MNAIKDSIHDYVSLGEIAVDLLDTPVVQRLRHIKQLSTVRLVYPSASHSRFEHSLGVYHLAKRALDQLDGVDPDGDRARHVRAAAILHDTGHGPYGHQTEEIIRRRTGVDHDETGWLLGDESRPVHETLLHHGLDPAQVATLIRGEGALGGLISGELDVDRMDYLVRDAHHTGVPYGTIDHDRLVRELRLADGEVVLRDGNLATAESLLVARSLMNATVYRHHVSRIAGAMLERACESYLSGVDGPSTAEFRRLADHDLLVALRDHTPALGRRIEQRDLYKRALWTGLDEVPAGVVDVTHEDERTAEREIAERADIEPRSVIVDVPPRPGLKESATSIFVDGSPERLEDASGLVSALRAGERARWRLGVYCPEPLVDTVTPVAKDVLGLRSLV